MFLTQDGGVFTCGSGRYGQLGHGSVSDEILPRMVTFLDVLFSKIKYFSFSGDGTDGEYDYADIMRG